MQRDTRMLMQTIGLPGMDRKVQQVSDENFLLRLLPLAARNKVPLFFLEQAVKVNENFNSLKKLYRGHFEKFELILRFLGQLSKTLNELEIDYVLFKTLKPFPFVPVDADLLFSTREDMFHVCNVLLDQGCRLAGSSAYSITLYDPKYNMNIDLQLEISVSRLVYINKKLLRNYVTKVNVNGSQVRILSPPVSLITVISHSLYKEQMFTLSDYYTTIIQISKMSDMELTIFRNATKEMHLEFGVKAFLTLSELLTKMVFHQTIPNLVKTAGMIQIDNKQDKIIRSAYSDLMRRIKLPQKYPFTLLLSAFIVKVAKDSVMRGSVVGQLEELATSPSKFFESMLLHVTREAY